jgi:transposase-like protein
VKRKIKTAGTIACSGDWLLNHGGRPPETAAHIQCHERVNQEIKRRTRVARLFPNEASILRLVTALLSEISNDGESGKIHLNMQTPTQPSV